MREIDLTKKDVSLAEINHFCTNVISQNKTIADMTATGHRENLIVCDVLSNTITGYKVLYYAEKYRIIKHLLDNNLIADVPQKSLIINNLKKGLKKINKAIKRAGKAENDISADRKMIFEGSKNSEFSEDFEKTLNFMSNEIYSIVRIFLDHTSEIKGSCIPAMLVECEKDEPCIKHFIDGKYYKILH